MNEMQLRCIDAETGHKFQMFAAGKITVDDPEQRDKLHRHATLCEACVRHLARQWLLSNFFEIAEYIENSTASRGINTEFLTVNRAD